MIAIIEALVLGFLILSVVYVVVSIYSRSVRREKLEKRFDAEVKTGDRERYVEEGMVAYQKGLRRKLLVLIYIIPMAVVAGTIYYINHSQ
ncbi:MAG: hypothetical protein DI533_12545 [Cereibacter sphaeroides]|uniref:Uncharacterized protein n=1 Tax=Cereibacter sphaeroides TaxID=1063 RepID=A0A2W5S7Q8_CERSP|nr:MAG: hypothetical protein DI533_12545 [Cereibacter sphaeroides]